MTYFAFSVPWLVSLIAKAKGRRTIPALKKDAGPNSHAEYNLLTSMLKIVDHPPWRVPTKGQLDYVASFNRTPDLVSTSDVERAIRRRIGELAQKWAFLTEAGQDDALVCRVACDLSLTIRRNILSVTGHLK